MGPFSIGCGGWTNNALIYWKELFILSTSSQFCTRSVQFVWFSVYMNMKRSRLYWLFSSSLILLNKDCFSWLVMCYSHLQVFQLQEFSICWLVVRGVLMPTLWSHYLESLQYLQCFHDSDSTNNFPGSLSDQISDSGRYLTSGTPHIWF